MASDEVRQRVYESLSGLKDGEVRPAARRLAAAYGVTEGTIYRYAASKGLRWRRPKSTKGASRVSRDVLKAAGALLYSSRRTNKQITMPASDAKEILEDSGLDTAVSTSWFRRRMREESVSAADIARPAPHVRLLSDHPNHVWQFDVTNCFQYFLDGPSGLGERDEELELSRNKIVRTAKSIRRELLRYAAVDHCTGAFYFRYFYASGERKEDGAQFLFEAMRPKEELSPSAAGKYHFHGVPFLLVADRGSIVAAKANQALLESLRISLETHLPGNPRAKGAVEGLMKHLGAFEARLRLRRPSSLPELNAWALDRCIYINAARLMRNVAPRSALWSTIGRDELRLCPDADLYRLLMREPVIERTADGSCFISVDGRAYKVPDTECAHKKVKVLRHPFEYPAVEAHFNGRIWLCEPIERDRYGRIAEGVRYGEYKRPAATATQAAKKEMEKIAEGWGLTWTGTGEKRRAAAPPVGHESPLSVFGNHAAKVPDNMRFIKRAGTPLEVEEPAPLTEAPDRDRLAVQGAYEVPRTIATRQISLADLLARIADETGAIPRELNAALRQAYPDGISLDDVENLVQEVREGSWTGRRGATAAWSMEHGDVQSSRFRVQKRGGFNVER